MQQETATMPVNSASEQGKTSLPAKPWLTALLLAVFVVTLNAWTTRHLGWGLENAFGISSIAAGLGLAGTLAHKLLPEGETGVLKISLSRVPMTLVLGLWFVFGSVAAMRSSVLVLTDSANKPLHRDAVRLARAETGTTVKPADQTTKADPVRFAVATSPLGRPYRLKIPGYIEQVFQVYPITGLTVIPERDLRVSPSVLFRPPTNALQELAVKSGGKFVILEVQGNSLNPLAVSCRRSSFLLGREQEIPPTWASLWDLELKVSQVSAVSSDDAATKLAWYRYTVLPPPHDLVPGDVIEARVISAGGSIVARARVTLGTDLLKDVPLLTDPSAGSLPKKDVPPCPTE
jgi:hypothetical protein